MDAPGLDEAVYARCLNDLASVNRVTFGHVGTLAWVRRAMAMVPAGDVVSVLDIASGQGDLLRAIGAVAAKAGRKVALTGIDLNPRSGVVARAASAGGDIEFVTGDIFAFEPRQKFDLIVTSQFTHHLPDEAVVRLVRWMDEHARVGWYVSDLHRHAVAFYGFRWLARLCGWHRIVRHDGTVSIARGFRRGEWEAMLTTAGVEAKVRWHLLFRHGVSRLK